MSCLPLDHRGYLYAGVTSVGQIFYSLFGRLPTVATTIMATANLTMGSASIWWTLTQWDLSDRPEGSQYDPNFYGKEGPLLDTGMFFSKSVMASTVDLQSCEGEIGTTVKGTKDVILMRGVLNELHQFQMRATPLFGDNDSTIRLGSSYNGNDKRVRHMLPKINWLMEQTQAGVIQLYRMGTDKLPPDTLTKISSGADWQEKLASL